MQKKECRHEFMHQVLEMPIKTRVALSGGGYAKEILKVPHIEIFCIRCGEHHSFNKNEIDYKSQHDA